VAVEHNERVKQNVSCFANSVELTRRGFKNAIFQNTNTTALRLLTPKVDVGVAGNIFGCGVGPSLQSNTRITKSNQRTFNGVQLFAQVQLSMLFQLRLITRQFVADLLLHPLKLCVAHAVK
jgi:hypothetical protein